MTDRVTEIMRATRRFFRAVHVAYTGVAQTRDGKRMLADLHGFCCARLADPNPFEQARYVGRYEVWLHIQERLRYREEDVTQLREIEIESRRREASA